MSQRELVCENARDTPCFQKKALRKSIGGRSQNERKTWYESSRALVQTNNRGLSGCKRTEHDHLVARWARILRHDSSLSSWPHVSTHIRENITSSYLQQHFFFCQPIFIINIISRSCFKKGKEKKIKEGKRPFWWEIWRNTIYYKII